MAGLNIPKLHIPTLSRNKKGILSGFPMGRKLDRRGVTSRKMFGSKMGTHGEDFQIGKKFKSKGISGHKSGSIGMSMKGLEKLLSMKGMGNGSKGGRKKKSIFGMDEGEY
jgi:hypothetical protein